MIGFKQFLLQERKEGDVAGHLEMVHTPIHVALEHANQVFQSYTGRPVTDIVPNFSINYKRAQNLARLGKTQRKDMPRIRRSDVWLLQRRLLRGALDVRRPFAATTNPGNPFPEGLTGEAAKQFMHAGFKDGDPKDDIVQVKEAAVAASALKPIQQQIYLDKVIGFLAREGTNQVKKSIETTFMVISSDNYIIDGHHRWLAALLIDPSIKMRGIQINLPIQVLLKLTLAYGDALGNGRNA